jgi:hypothetical protein
MSCSSFADFSACLCSGYIIIQCSLKSIVISMARISIRSGLALFTNHLMKFLMSEAFTVITFIRLTKKNAHILYEMNASETAEFKSIAEQYVDILMRMFRIDIELLAA